MGLMRFAFRLRRLLRMTHDAVTLAVAELRCIREDLAAMRASLAYCRTCGVVLYDPHPAVDREQFGGEITIRCAPCGAVRRFRALDLDRREN